MEIVEYFRKLQYPSQQFFKSIFLKFSDSVEVDILQCIWETEN